MDAAQPLARARPHPLGRAVAALGAHRPGDVPVPRLRQPAVHRPGARLPPCRAVARAQRARLAAGAGRRGAGHRRRAPPVAGADPALRALRGGRRPPRECRVCGDGDPDGTGQRGRQRRAGGPGRGRGCRGPHRLVGRAPLGLAGGASACAGSRCPGPCRDGEPGTDRRRRPDRRRGRGRAVAPGHVIARRRERSRPTCWHCWRS